jgi:hypothetical protein
VRFSLLVGEQIEAERTPGQKPPSTPAEIKPTAVEVAPGAAGLFVQADFARVRQQLDGTYFYLSKFDHCVISYKGGPFYFDDNNEIKDSYLLLDQSVDAKDPKVNDLIRKHKWLQVMYQR